MERKESRGKRIRIYLSVNEKAELKKRAERAGMETSRYCRELLFRRIRNRLDAAIFDEVHRVRVELRKHGGLLVQMRNRILAQRSSKDLKAELHDALNENAKSSDLVATLKSSIEEKINRDHEEDITD